MSLRADLLKIIAEKIGGNATPEQVIAFLLDGGAINDASMRSIVVPTEFYRLYGRDSERTARDVEEELAVRYDMTRDGIVSLRLRALRKKRTAGRPRS